MKTLLIAVGLLALGSSVALCVTQYHNIGSVNMSSSTISGGFGLSQRTSAALNALTPTTTGQVFYCGDCTTTRVCVSTSVWPNSVVAVSSGALSACK